MLDLSLPRNNFALAAGARRHRLIAGGIGITPLLSMAHALDRRGDPYELHYCARSPSRAAFRDELARLSGGAVSLHYDNGDPSHGLDVSGLLRDVVDGMHVYYCGPRGLMRAASEATAHWPRETIHFEHFAAPVAVSPTPGTDGAFEVELASNAAVYPVPANRSILAVLRDAGVLVESSCEAGVCGTCRTRYLAGTPDHQDFVLTDDERRECIMLCVSRAAPGERIVLDL
jgi:vanillate O-demethylase ferredoxin subunit